MNDQSFHEIQLSGKQLVFLFMSAVVLAVVVFLLGVSVGRGVRGSVASASTADVGAPTDTTASAAPAGTKVTPADLDYREKLQGQGGATSGAAAGAAAAATTTAKPAETPATTPPPATPNPASTKPTDKPNFSAMADDPSKAKAATPSPTSTPKPTPTKPATPPPAAKPAPAVATPAAKPNDASWFVQLNAFSTKGAADTFIRELKGKGYTASAVSTATLFKVRMGPFADRADADKMAGRLTKDGYKPLVTR